MYACMYEDLGKHVLVDDLHFLGEVEAVVERPRLREHLREHAVQDRPELVQVVLQRRSGENQLRVGLDLADGLGDERFLVLDLVALVENQVAPVDARPEGVPHVLRDSHLVRRQHDVEARHVREGLLLHPLPLPRRGRVQANHPKAGAPR